jgi:crossover junction endodeoxyribonuclease RuvC
VGTKAFLPTPARRRSALARLPARVLAAAGIDGKGELRDQGEPRDEGEPRDQADPRNAERSRPTQEIRPAATRPTVILGIDPGTLVVGYGAITIRSRSTGFLGAGVVRAGRGSPVPERLARIQERLLALLEEIRPDLVVIERAFAAKNVQSALRIGEGRGVALACAAAFGAEVLEIPPASAKKSVAGHGAAGKAQVARMVAVALGLREPPKPLDASDALALALAAAFARTESFQVGRVRKGSPRLGRELEAR